MLKHLLLAGATGDKGQANQHLASIAGFMFGIMENKAVKQFSDDKLAEYTLNSPPRLLPLPYLGRR